MEQDKKILIVDDSKMSRVILKKLFEEEYEILEAEDGRVALDILEEEYHSIAVVLLDNIMPEMNGIDVLRKIAGKYKYHNIPVVMITAETSERLGIEVYRLGIADLISKPFNQELVKRRVQNIIELYDYRCELEWTIAEQINEIEEQSRKLRRSNQFFIDTLSTAVEFRSSESGEHISRIRNVTQLLLEALGQQEAQYRFNSDMIEIISNAAAMHDIGKIAIPDAILNKPGRLTPEEFELMKSHTTRGCEILEKLSSVQLEEYYRFSYDICRYHHERWDGNGYPDHLKGSEIPIWAQVVSVADVYDALVSKRVYKPAFSHQTAVDMILNGECGVFNPMLMSILSLIAPQLEKFYTGNVLPADEPFEFR